MKSVTALLIKYRVLLMAISAGAAVANIYYNQPLLKHIALAFNTSESEAGLTSTLTQIGYGIGLFFIIPLGDKLNRKKLILSLLLALIVSLALMTLAPNIQTVWLMSVMIGIMSVSVQVIMPLAASMDTETTGKTVGTVFAGILIGILSARVFGGLVAEWFGWRSVFGISAVSMLLLTLMLRIILPDIPNTFRGRYRELLISALKQIPRFPRLRKASMSGFLLFGVFCSFWTTLTFHLSRPPFLFHSDTIGLFGLVAIAGALIAPAFGKRADKGLARHSMILAVSLTIVSIILLKFISDSVMAILFAVFLLDIGVQILQVTNMAVIYSLDATSHSRVNTIFMTTLFIGGAVGTSAGLYCWKTGGWDWVTWQMLLWSVLALIVVLLPDTEASIKDISVGEQRLPDGAQSK